MRINILFFTDKGEKLAEKLASQLTEYESKTCSKDKEVVKKSFEENIPLIVIGAVGIAVRLISPFVNDKLTDIPVVVCDEFGINVIPILSGHVGGANKIAIDIAGAIGAQPIITTATDLNETFAVDVFAGSHGLNIDNKQKIKDVSTKVLRGEPILISVEDYPPTKKMDVIISKEKDVQTDCLHLSPKMHVLGIGCKRGKTLAEIEEAVNKCLDMVNITINDVYCIASIDVKKDEQGLKDFSDKYRIPFVTFTANALAKAPGGYSASDFVKETVGVDNVCERASVIGAGPGSTLLSKKIAYDGITIAVAKRSIWW